MHKKIRFLLFILPTFLFAQWTQVEQDIDGENNDDLSGYSISMSSDGSIVAIGAPGNDDGDNNAGHVRIYQNSGTNWQQIGQDINGEFWFGLSGFSVSLSSDGSIVAIGEPIFSGEGRVRVYQNNSGTWQQLGQDIMGEGSDDESGVSVSMSSNGSIVAIGAPLNNGNGSNSGHVRVYENNAGTWQQIGIDLDGDDAGDNAGISVSLSADGSIMAMGAPYGASNNRGEVKVYQNVGGSWQQVGQDIEGTNDDSEFGISVSLSNDGNTLAVGSSYDIDISTFSSASVRVYQNVGGTWQQIGTDITNPVSVIEYARFPVSLSGDASTLAIGAPLDDILYSGDRENSYAQIYKNESGIWQQVDQNINEATLEDAFGSSISLSDDGATVAVGANYHDNSKGHVRVFFNSNILNTQENIQNNSAAIFPNPSKGKATIRLHKQFQKIQVQVYDMLGKEVISTTYTDTSIITLHISQQPKGMYFVKTTADEMSFTHKLIKQ
ncbi:MAG: T9SS type A sorting domain-containing protein [Bacteroidota bacterium]